MRTEVHLPKLKVSSAQGITQVLNHSEGVTNDKHYIYSAANSKSYAWNEI